MTCKVLSPTSWSFEIYYTKTQGKFLFRNICYSFLTLQDELQTFCTKPVDSRDMSVNTFVRNKPLTISDRSQFKKEQDQRRLTYILSSMSATGLNFYNLKIDEFQLGST
jgi:hypothetical protein